MLLVNQAIIRCGATARQTICMTIFKFKKEKISIYLFIEILNI